ncbi:MAG: hypothetical protein ABR972_08420 [Acidimicrobiales bacterium]
MTKDDDAADAFFEKHAVAKEIWQARPYERWELGDPGNIARRHFADMNRNQRAHVSKVVNTAPGWVIRRYPPPLPDLPKIYPEQRPDWPVQSREPRRHWHGSGEPPPDPKWYRVFTGDPDDPYSSLYEHIHQKKDDSEDETKPKHPDDKLGADGRNCSRNQHLGTNTEEIHTHFDFAKYVFPPAPKMEGGWTHDHDWVEDDKGQRKPRKWQPKAGQKGMTRDEVRNEHLANYHDDGIDKVGLHPHPGRKVKDPTNPIASRLDVHPMAMQKIKEKSIVYFAIEGCIKADAILTAGGAVFSVPSVGQWDCKELEDFARYYLARKIVVIVPDADWETNPNVYTQAFLCSSRLRRFYVPEVIVAAPPPYRLGKKTKGVDDFLHEGGHLEELIVVDSVPPEELPPGVPQIKIGSRHVSPLGCIIRALELERGNIRKDRWERDAKLAGALSAYAGEDGIFARSSRSTKLVTL